jgi:hypothetical protein
MKMCLKLGLPTLPPCLYLRNATLYVPAVKITMTTTNGKESKREGEEGKLLKRDLGEGGFEGTIVSS